ncbi:MAG: DUF1553 domain-containing protein [Acidobacteriia bacterium]|nr:DUF1553 domain-containing protein [Terriglobia bacterium]
MDNVINRMLVSKIPRALSLAKNSLSIVLFFSLILSSNLWGNSQQSLLSLSLVPQKVVLSGTGASQRFLVLATYSNGQKQEITSKSSFSISDPRIAKVDGHGRVVSLSDGKTTITAKIDGHTATAVLWCENSLLESPVSFVKDITQILTKQSCNSSSCHGGVKGRGGFRLSSNASHPLEDYEWIKQGGGYQVLTDQPIQPRNPRISIEIPEKSLILQKPAMLQPHGGGQRFEEGSEDYDVLLSWIQAGAPYTQPEKKDLVVERIQVFPEEAILDRLGKHQMLVTAHFSNRRQEDVTNQVHYESLDAEILQVTSEGLVKAKRVGEAVILVRYPGKVAVARFGVISKFIEDYPLLSRTNFIDEEIFNKLERFHIIPSGLSSDSEFLRRVCLDITGTLPPPSRVREFIANQDSQKREKLVRTLLNSPEYIEYWTFRLADLFRVKVSQYSYWEWIRRSLKFNKPYDLIAQERIAAQGSQGPSSHFSTGGDFHAEQVVAEQFRVFFGRRMDCAQCHNHPYDRWTQNQFWGLAAFFGRTTSMGTGPAVVYDDPLGQEENFGTEGRTDLTFAPITHPRSKMLVNPTFLDGQRLQDTSMTDLRMDLARWMTAQTDFSEATVNRVWGHFFGRGLVDPVDDFRLGNPPTHPRLLQILADDFQRHGHDLKHLIQRIVLSRTYQLSSSSNKTNRRDTINYSRAFPRALEAEVLLDALSSATGVAEAFLPPEGIYDFETAPPETRAINLKFPSNYHSLFLDVFGRPQRDAVGDRNNQVNLSQALHMLVGSTYLQKLSKEDGRLHQLIQKKASDEKIIDELYLASLCRFPSVLERKQLMKRIKAHSSRKEALEDILLALISSREFSENH